MNFELSRSFPYCFAESLLGPVQCRCFSFLGYEIAAAARLTFSSFSLRSCLSQITRIASVRSARRGFPSANAEIERKKLSQQEENSRLLFCVFSPLHYGSFLPPPFFSFAGKKKLFSRSFFSPIPTAKVAVGNLILDTPARPYFATHSFSLRMEKATRPSPNFKPQIFFFLHLLLRKSIFHVPIVRKFA